MWCFENSLEDFLSPFCFWQISSHKLLNKLQQLYCSTPSPSDKRSNVLETNMNKVSQKIVPFTHFFLIFSNIYSIFTSNQHIHPFSLSDRQFNFVSSRHKFQCSFSQCFSPYIGSWKDMNWFSILLDPYKVSRLSPQMSHFRKWYSQCLYVKTNISSLRSKSYKTSYIKVTKYSDLTALWANPSTMRSASSWVLSQLSFLASFSKTFPIGDWNWMCAHRWAYYGRLTPVTLSPTQIQHNSI